ncbi:hypothetical protein NUW54_g709 [Trametes sanguinea]|uniref:Uncharacterized protein n=1 Tax=Trametes sanguinea TaxID=158606 RepID=A0ACC1Q8F6_9APHY|nr:hypothetical protein NUW54_g709 [Trametes sanguinea]
MPKAASSPSNRPALRRNQAHRVASALSKLGVPLLQKEETRMQWQSLISVPPPVGYAHPTEPQCSYDPVEGLPIAPNVDPSEKIRMLEDQIAQLKSQLENTRNYNSRSASPRHAQLTHNGARYGSGSSNGQTPESSPNGGGIVLPHASLEVMHQLSPDSTGSQPRGSTSSPELRQGNNRQTMPDPLMDLLFVGWDPDLPDPDTLDHYIDIFFKCDPCGSRILHRPSFLASMALHPKDPNYPHPAILHAIVSISARFLGFAI